MLSEMISSLSHKYLHTGILYMVYQHFFFFIHRNLGSALKYISVYYDSDLKLPILIGCYTFFGLWVTEEFSMLEMK